MCGVFGGKEEKLRIFIYAYSIVYNMPKIKSGYFNTKRTIIQKIKNVIKDNPEIKSHILIAKLNVNYPYIAEKTALELIKNLTIDGQIYIDEVDTVTILHRKERDSS